MKRNEKLDADIAKGLKPIKPKTPRFYLLLKIHKEGNPGRPVISSVDCHTSRIYAFVDYHIQDSAQSLKSYVNPIQYGLFLKHYGMGGGGIMAPLVTWLFLKVEGQNLVAWGILMCLLQKWY